MNKKLCSVFLIIAWIVILVPITAYADELSINTEQTGSTSANDIALAISNPTLADVDVSEEESDIALLTTASGSSISRDGADAIANGEDALEFILDVDSALASNQQLVVFAERNGVLSDVDVFGIKGNTTYTDKNYGYIKFTDKDITAAQAITLTVKSSVPGTVKLKAYLVKGASDTISITQIYNGSNEIIKSAFVGNGCSGKFNASTIQAVVPVFSVPSGTIAQGSKVSLSTETEKAQIYYTLDGSEPDETAQLYQKTLIINENVTIKAIAIKDGLQNSPIATVSYKVITDSQPFISVGTKTVYSGNEASIAISIKNNPGLVSMRLNVNYDKDALTLLKVEDKGLLGNEMHSDNLSTMPYILYWNNGNITTDYVDNGEIVILTFSVAENAEIGYYPISIFYDSANDDILNKDLENVELAIINGNIYVSDVLLGDVNNDGKVTPLDDIYLARYLADWSGYAEKIDLLAADVNNDGKVTPLDNVILARNLAGWQGYESLPYIK